MLSATTFLQTPDQKKRLKKKKEKERHACSLQTTALWALFKSKPNNKPANTLIDVETVLWHLDLGFKSDIIFYRYHYQCKGSLQMVECHFSLPECRR